jgi:hypothetical protein
MPVARSIRRRKRERVVLLCSVAPDSPGGEDNLGEMAADFAVAREPLSFPVRRANFSCFLPPRQSQITCL